MNPLILAIIQEKSSEILNAVGNKLGVASLSANIGIAAMIEAGIIDLVGSWGLADTAIVISMCVSIMFFFKLRMDYKKTKLEIELMKKKDKE